MQKSFITKGWTYVPCHVRACLDCNTNGKIPDEQLRWLMNELIIFELDNIIEAHPSGITNILRDTDVKIPRHSKNILHKIYKFYSRPAIGVDMPIEFILLEAAKWRKRLNITSVEEYVRLINAMDEGKAYISYHIEEEAKEMEKVIA